jgi:hypothetical protein
VVVNTRYGSASLLNNPGQVAQPTEIRNVEHDNGICSLQMLYCLTGLVGALSTPEKKVIAWRKRGRVRDCGSDAKGCQKMPHSYDAARAVSVSIHVGR